jgi:hypothetical protein
MYVPSDVSGANVNPVIQVFAKLPRGYTRLTAKWSRWQSCPRNMRAQCGKGRQARPTLESRIRAVCLLNSQCPDLVACRRRLATRLDDGEGGGSFSKLVFYFPNVGPTDN